jgi:hypothetical protein
LCYNATQTIIVAGSGTTFLIESGGSATLIAGQNILLLQGTKVIEDGYLHGKITLSGPYCGQLPASLVTSAPAGREENAVSEAGEFLIYPNPNNGTFTLEAPGSISQETVDVEILNSIGQRKILETVHPVAGHTFQLSTLPPGIYLVRISSNSGATTIKMIRR